MPVRDQHILQNAYLTTFLEIFSNYWIWLKFDLKNYADLGWCYIFCFALLYQNNTTVPPGCLVCHPFSFCISVYQKSVNSNFREFWLAPVTWNILDISFRDIFGRWNFSDKWSSHTKWWILACRCSVVGRKLFSC